MTIQKRWRVECIGDGNNIFILALDRIVRTIATIATTSAVHCGDGQVGFQKRTN